MTTTPFLTFPSEDRRYRSLSVSPRSSFSGFRSLRLQLILQFTRWRNVQEPRKTATYQSRGAALFHVGLHIIPLVAGTILLVLNFGKFFIRSVPSNALTALQFASKLLEIFIQASISTMALAYIRNEVLNARGVPFGGLIAPFRTMDVSSLWSLELWGCLTSSGLDQKRRLIFSVLFPAAVILAALVGPSSAVLMIPRPADTSTFSWLTLLSNSEDLLPRNVTLSDSYMM